MGISQTLGLAALLGIPFIIILYMLKPKHQDRVVASTYLWQQVFDEIESASKIHRLRKSILLFLEILAMLLITAILSGVFLKNAGSSQHHILVLDGSLSMQSTDVKPTRFEEAKNLATDYLNQLDDGALVSVVVLRETPEILFREEEDLALVRDGIRQIQSSMNYVDKALAYETIQALSGDLDYDLVYFGDDDFQGARLYRIAKDERNLSLHGLSMTVYENSLSALTEVVNDSPQEETVPVSIYVDDLYLTTKEVMIAPKEATRVFFDGIPKETKILKAVIETTDRLLLDNEAYGVVTPKVKSRLAYVSQGNLFLEKIMDLQDQIEVYEIDEVGLEMLTGYDLYLFDGISPDSLPTDGNILMIDLLTDAVTDSLSIGYIENPMFETANHPTTHLIEEPEFKIAVTQVFDIDRDTRERKESIYETEHGTIAYSWENGRNRGVVFGFDFRYSDLPLGIEYPILMTNTFNYLLNPSALSSSQLSVGQALDIGLSPDTEKAWIETPQGETFSLSNEDKLITFRDADQIGIYTLNQQIEDVIETEYFAVNTPQKKTITSDASSEKGEGQTYYTGKDLSIWIGTLLIIVLLLEWFIYSRRKRYAR